MRSEEKMFHHSARKERNTLFPMALVDKALEELTFRAKAGAIKLRQAELQLLCSSLLETKEQCYEIVALLVKKGISIKDLFETYFPESAKLLGEKWLEDKLSFAEVTVAMTQLQQITREYESLYYKNEDFEKKTPEILIVVPPGESHSYGPQMAMRKFKNLGTNTYVAIGHDVIELNKLLKLHNFKLIGFSIADLANEKHYRNCIGSVKSITKSKIPLMIGGSAIESINQPLKDIGVDLISNNPKYALDYFGIRASKENNFDSQLTII